MWTCFLNYSPTSCCFEWYGQLAKVDNFYQDKTNEISQRVDGLLESVDASFVKPPKKNHHRRSTSLEAWVINKFGPMIHGDRLRPVVPQDQGSALPDIERVFSASSYHNEDDDSEKKRKELERVKKSDSIQRAITDIYRTAKLLHNFCILNYTGFSEVAGMFDRTFPVHKGTFKGKLCDDGKQTEMLATKMEKMYSTWFCEGDVLKAQAQMLPKRGDGLLMDWSQMRLGYRLGMCSILALWVAWDSVWGVIDKGQVSIAGRVAFPVFRGCFGLVAWHWFWVRAKELLCCHLSLSALLFCSLETQLCIKLFYSFQSKRVRIFLTTKGYVCVHLDKIPHQVRTAR